ncbi:Alpha/Beta hydrolase protein [Stachybotrys elegans]|uniref:Alpha/Beta hydrolase protein n=1 Tax=Stachybotrys elegans TaxID=80388 RepID=A0A8K0T8R6_9HYPO|nr:Alpha/Beta hydrolase protein [Stachybotrys elegans]
MELRLNDMDLSKLTKKVITVPRGFEYTYYTVAAQDSKPTLLLFHGWPDTSRLWAGFINQFLIPNGYGVIAVDCLGFGGSSKPTDPVHYSWQKMAADALHILDTEEILQVVSVGHDWGSAVASRFYNFHPSRVSGLVNVNVRYMPPITNFDLDTMNKRTKEAFGYSPNIYWSFMVAEDSADIMDNHLESLYSVMFGSPETYLETLCAPDGLRNFLTQDCTQPTMPYATAEHKADFIDRVGKDGVASTLCHYTALTTGVQTRSDSLLDQKPVDVPVLFWGGERDYICKPALVQSVIATGCLPNIKVVTRDGGHWALLEKPAEFGQDVLEWLGTAFGA